MRVATISLLNLPALLFRWTWGVEPRFSTWSWRWLLGRPLHRSTPMKAHAAYSFFTAVMYFLQTHRSLCKRQLLCIIEHGTCLSYCYCTCDLNILGTRMEASFRLSRNGVWHCTTSSVLKEEEEVGWAEWAKRLNRRLGQVGLGRQEGPKGRTGRWGCWTDWAEIWRGKLSEIKIDFLNLPMPWKVVEGDFGGILTQGLFLNSSRILKEF
jgi:hypothetical protein